MFWFRNSLATCSLLGAACLPVDPGAPLPTLGQGASQLTEQPLDLYHWLDRDGDGVIEAFEGAEAFLALVESADTDGDGGLSTGEIAAFMGAAKALRLEVAQARFRGADADRNAALSIEEFPALLRPLFASADRNSDGSVDFDEFRSIDFDAPSTLLRLEVQAIQAELAAAGEESPTAEEIASQLEQELAGARFHVEQNVAVMRGTIGANTPGRVLQLILEHPEVRTISMEDVPGSLDDEANLRAALMIHRFRFTTIIPSTAEVASGGIDFFLAGTQRQVGKGARLGVHSWSAEQLEQGADLPREHPGHDLYLDFYRAIGIPKEFYWFTLGAASPDDIHWMSAAEIEQFGFETEP